MTDDEDGHRLLGKRSRRESAADAQHDEDMGGDTPHVPIHDERAGDDAGSNDSDDDVGPMPMPEESAGNGAPKKKRKGESPSIWRMCYISGS
jgi:hypothetical protein